MTDRELDGRWDLDGQVFGISSNGGQSGRTALVLEYAAMNALTSPEMSIGVLTVDATTAQQVFTRLCERLYPHGALAKNPTQLSLFLENSARIVVSPVSDNQHMRYRTFDLMVAIGAHAMPGPALAYQRSRLLSDAEGYPAHFLEC